jgi:hypothetical protein
MSRIYQLELRFRLGCIEAQLLLGFLCSYPRKRASLVWIVQEHYRDKIHGDAPSGLGPVNVHANNSSSGGGHPVQIFFGNVLNSQQH